MRRTTRTWALVLGMMLSGASSPALLAAPTSREGRQTGKARGKRPPRSPPPATPSGNARPAPGAVTPPPEAPPSSGASSPERAWARGVSAEARARALELFQEGNALLKESIFVQAIEKYREALTLWSHPAIHYNLALALMNLDQPIEIHDHLEAALRFGAEPLEAEKFEYARNYKLLLEKQLAFLDVTCDTPGAAVFLNGRALFQAPGRYSGLVRPGVHTVAASLQGHLPEDQKHTLLPGQTAHVALRLYTAEQLTRYRRSFPVPLPWLVMGAGAVLVGGSAWMHFTAFERFDRFDAGIQQCGGCVPSRTLSIQLRQGHLLQGSAITGYAVGSAALVTGAILATLNQPQPYRIDPSQLTQPPVSVSVAPLLGGGAGGVQAWGRF